MSDGDRDENHRRKRLLILIVAYHAASTLDSVLRRIPERTLDEYDCEVLVVDDASQDSTFQVGRDYKTAHPELPLTVLRNHLNQGYGGNQKVGYTYAINNGFDIVALVHGDGQYAPEALPNLLLPLHDGRADAVFGSRMMVPGRALKGGMPLYKYVGNRILTTVQNLLLNTHLSEFHSGYRIYSVDALRSIPFRLNTNDFHFDTEIIIQLLNQGARIVEAAIPTYYGTEICRVNGLKYAADVLRATWAAVLHRWGIFYQRRYDVSSPERSPYSLKLGYPSSHTYALEAVPPAARVLDLGAGPGSLARELLAKGCSVALVDRLPIQCLPKDITAFQQDLNDALEFSVTEYDYILLLDVIEHLVDPERFLDRLRAKLDYRPRTVLISVPNVAFVVQRIMLLLGQFNYGKAGILDRTHTRLFTERSLRQLLDDAGLRVRRLRGVPAPFPRALGDGRLGRTAVRLNQFLIRVSRSLFSYQFFVEAEPTPDVDFVLNDTQNRSRLAAPGS